MNMPNIMDYYLQSFPVLLLLLALSVPPSAAEPNSQNNHTDCAPNKYACGDQSYEIAYPFGFGDRPKYCSYPGYELTCGGSDSPTTLSTNLGGTKEYQVADNIDYTNHVIHVKDPSLAGQSCPKTIETAKFNLTLFDYTTEDLNLTVYLNCNNPITNNFPTFQKIGCLGDLSYYNLSDGEIDGELEKNCSSVAVVPINESAVEELVSKFGDVIGDGFGVEWRVGREWCNGCIKSGGICGYDSNSPSSPTCFCPTNAISVGGRCTPITGNSSSKKKTMKIIIGSSVIGIVGFISACLVLFLYIRRHDSIIPWKKKNDENIEAFLEKYGSLCPTRYHYSDVKRITKSFDTKLGQGGYGLVFKGTLEDGRQVAVKVLSESKGNGEEFVNEVASIGRTSHVNVVSLLGFCSEGSKRALIYDFMCNGSLEKFIYSEKPKTTLGLEKLYKIAIGIARGLEYLHRGCNTRIVHFDIKPHNILLDEDFCPKISDFGLAKLCLQKDSILSMAGTRGTIGYIAPEVFSRNFGVISSKSDVYSYGMMVLEMVGGRRNVSAVAENTSEIYFPHWIYDHLDLTEDLQSCGVTTETEEIARKMILVGLWCIQTMPQNRPPMGRVIDMLEGDISDLQMPPKPYLSSPPRSIMGTSSSLSVS